MVDFQLGSEEGDNAEGDIQEAEESILKGQPEGIHPQKSQEIDGDNDIGDSGDIGNDPIEKRKLIVHILRYKDSNLCRYLSPFNLELARLKGMEENALKELLSEIQLTVALRSSNNFNKEVFFNGVALLEPVATKYTPYNCTGLGSILRQDPEVSDILEEISLQKNKYTPPEIRLAMSILKTTIICSSINTRKEGILQETNKTVESGKVDKYKDL